MAYLFFDTETTGLPEDFDAPVTDTDNWHPTVQIAWAPVSVAERTIGETESHIIKPDGFEIPPDATAIHGISTGRARREGHRLGDVLDRFLKAAGASEGLVAHNITFDVPTVRAELVRLKRPDPLAGISTICTKEESTDYCQLPSTSRWHSGYKWPSLQELHKILFGHDFKNAHDAGGDVKAGARCFLELVDRGVIDPCAEEEITSPSQAGFPDLGTARPCEGFPF
jgi:DNA polymerase III epsilon subunit-like protein